MHCNSEEHVIQNKPMLLARKGNALVKFLFGVLLLSILAGMFGYVYFAWQGKDLSGIAGRKEIISGRNIPLVINLLEKLQNAHNGNYIVTLTEEEINLYLAKKLKATQVGVAANFTRIKGVYVDLSPDVIEIFIERTIAQYDEEGKLKPDSFEPFDHTVSMKIKISTKGLDIKVDFPGGSIGKSPAPRSLVKVVKPSYDLLLEFFKNEMQLAYHDVKSIKIQEGKVIIEPK